jgi:ABC-2 type transport system permease protein
MIGTGAPGATAPVLPPVAAPASLGRLLALEVMDELRAIVREPTTLFFSIVMPVGFFALLSGIWGDETTLGVGPVGTAMLATFGTFGVVGVTLLTPGIGISEDQERGWLRAKRVSATPLPVTLLGKTLATVPYAVGVLTAMTAVAALNGTLQLTPVAWARLVAVLVVGALPLALFGLAVGLRLPPNPATAVLNAVYFPASVASGLWMPLETLPELISRSAPWLPTYHLGQLALAQIGDSDGSVAVHVGALVLTTIVGALLAAVAYRRARP